MIASVMNARARRDPGLRPQDVSPRFDRLLFEAPRVGGCITSPFPGSRKSFAIVRALSRTARVALVMLIVARETACDVLADPKRLADALRS